MTENNIQYSHVDIGRSGLPARLKRIRQQHGLSRQELADRAGLSSRTLRDLENGKRDRFQEKTVLLLAEALGVELSVLMGDEPGPSVDSASGRRFSPMLLAILGLILLVAVLGGIGYSLSISRATFDIVDGDVVARDGLGGRELWTLDWRANAQVIQTGPWREGALLVGLGYQASDGGRVLVIDRKDGRVLDELMPDIESVRQAFGYEILAEGIGFSVRGLHLLDLDGDGASELLVEFIHAKYYPFILAVYESDGHRLGHYLSRGHISEVHIEDLDGDGCDEVIASGTNNSPAFQGATLIRLEEGFWSGATFDRISGGRADIPDSAAARLVVPSFGQPYMGLLGRTRLTARGTSTFRGPDGRTMITTSLAAGEIGVILTCDAELNPVKVAPSDAFRAAVAAWPDSVKLREGFPSQAWLDRWLATASRFEAGDWPPR